MRLFLAALLLSNSAMGFRPVHLTHLNSVAYQDSTLPIEGPFSDGPLGPRFAPGSLAIVAVEANFNPPERDRYFHVQPKILFQQNGASRELAIVKKLDGANSSAYAVQLPMDAGFGQAAVVVYYPDDQNSVTLEMVKTNLELIRDPRVNWQASAVKNGMAVGLANPLQTGKQATLLATGLGRTPEAGGITVKIGNSGIDVGPVKVRKDGAGLDFVDFEVPPTAETNCYSAVKVYVNGVAVDSLFLPVSKDEKPCPHPSGFSERELAGLDAGKCVVQGDMGFNSYPSEKDLSKFFTARFSTYFAEELFYPPYASNPALQLITRILTQSTSCQTSKVTYTVNEGSGNPATSGVIVDPYRLPRDCKTARTSDFLGESKLSIKSPSNVVTPLAATTNSDGYQGTLVSIEPGIWEIIGTESTGNGYFQWHVPISPLRELSMQPDALIPQNRKLVVSWNSVGYKKGDEVYLMLTSSGDPLQVFACNAEASSGRIDIAPENLAALSHGKPNQSASLSISLRTKPEFRTGETKAGVPFGTSVGGYFAETRCVTLQ